MGVMVATADMFLTSDYFQTSVVIEDAIMCSRVAIENSVCGLLPCSL